jgi:hypothetical protein
MAPLMRSNVAQLAEPAFELGLHVLSGLQLHAQRFETLQQFLFHVCDFAL